MTRIPSLVALAAASGVLGLAGGVAAQTPPAPPAPPGFDARPDGPPPPPGGFRPGRDGGPGPMHPPFPPPRGARFHVHVNRGDTRVDVRCAENEPMRACVDAANALLDKLGVQAR